MNLEFSLDGKKVAALVMGLCMLGVLAFIAGMLVGATVSAPGAGTPEQAQSASGAKADSSSEGGHAPGGGVPGSVGVSALTRNPLARQGMASLQKSSPELAKVAGNPLAKQGVTALSRAGAGKSAGAGTAPSSGAGVAAGAATTSQASSGGTQAKADASPEKGSADQPSGPDPKGGSETPEAEARPDGADGQPAPPGSPDGGDRGKAAPSEGTDRGGDAPPKADEVGKRFTVQVGSFLMEKNARNLLEDLGGRGYSPYLFESRDGKGRVWHVVRFGDYPDRKQADQAASGFMKKEKRSAIVSVRDAP